MRTVAAQAGSLAARDLRTTLGGGHHRAKPHFVNQSGFATPIPIPVAGPEGSRHPAVVGLEPN